MEKVSEKICNLSLSIFLILSRSYSSGKLNMVAKQESDMKLKENAVPTHIHR